MKGRLVGVWLLGLCATAAAGEAKPVRDRAAPISPGQVRLRGWLGKRVEANWKNRLMAVSLDERLRPFRTPAERGGWSGEHVGKWLHAAAISWAYCRDAGLRKRLDQAVAALTACQAPDGYLGTYATAHRWGGWDVWTHKYNLMGLMACHEHAADPRALAAARRIGDLLADTFGEGKRDILRSGTHVGMAATSVLEPLVLLHRATGEPRYLALARTIVRAYDRPHGPKIVASLTSTRSVARTANRKAYEMMSNLVGLCELYRSTGDTALLKPCLYAHDDIVENQMYLTGGTSLGEHFQKPHHLPNTGRVSENCAQVTWLQLCIQLLRITGDATYADSLERVVYNHLLAAQKPSGEALCYFTPLRGRKPYSRGTNCCTSSGPRGIALITTVAYTLKPDAIMVNLYEPSTLDAELAGTKITLTQHTRYPLDGAVELLVEPQKPAAFGLLLRIPGWCKSYTIAVNGKPLRAEPGSGIYLKLARQWHKGDRVALDLRMPARLVEGTHTNEGLVAVQRGPLVLAVDARLNPGRPPTQVSLAAQADGTLPLEPIADPEGIAAHAFRGQAIVPEADGDEVALRHAPLVLTSFAEAGQTGSTYAVWLPSAERLKRLRLSPFLLATESYSRRGNVDGRIADGDASTWRVTFDGKTRDDDWFAVQRPKPATIDTVVYAHGRCYHDGGWWDASKGKPRIQLKSSPDGAWEDAATLDRYPATTATDPKGLRDGAEFVVRFPPRPAVAIRVVGAPACGDDPRQAFASCAELQGLLHKPK